MLKTRHLALSGVLLMACTTVPTASIENDACAPPDAGAPTDTVVPMDEVYAVEEEPPAPLPSAARCDARWAAPCVGWGALTHAVSTGGSCAVSTFICPPSGRVRVYTSSADFTTPSTCNVQMCS